MKELLLKLIRSIEPSLIPATEIFVKNQTVAEYFGVNTTCFNDDWKRTEFTTT